MALVSPVGGVSGIEVPTSTCSGALSAFSELARLHSANAQTLGTVCVIGSPSVLLIGTDVFTRLMDVSEALLSECSQPSRKRALRIGAEKHVLSITYSIGYHDR